MSRLALATLIVGLLASLLPASNAEHPQVSEDLDEWLEDDAEARAAAVSEGELVFLAQPPEDRVPHSANTLTIRQDSLTSGWVALVQCYDGLDPVPDAEVVYRYRRLRDLRIRSTQNITRAWVEGESVQLSDVRHGARLCIEAEVGILYPQADGGFTLRNGPFHRKFLDGYFPMHVTMDLRYPHASLAIEQTRPQPQPGFTVSTVPGVVTLDAWFEGELTVEVDFSPVSP